MRNVTYAYLGPEDQAGKFAKKGTATDITLFNARKGEDHLNLVTASRFPEKIMSLLLALDMSDEVVLAPQAVDRSLGEQIVAAELLGKTKGFLRPGPSVPMEQLTGLLSKTQLKDLTPSTEPEAVFRERLYERCLETGGEGGTLLPVDHSFPVKGVGTVILGLVRRGIVASHQTLQAFPGTKTVDVRSIQIHDVDFSKAPPRSRVGLAVKGVEPEDVKRGTVLAPPGSVKVLAPGAPLAASVRAHPFSKWAPRAGAVLHLFHCLQDVVARVESIDGAKATLRLDAPLAYAPDQPCVLVDVDNKAQRLVGRVEFA